MKKETKDQIDIICSSREKTKDLVEKVKDLERFYRLAIGRELKMIELKKQIRELEKENEILKEKGGENR